ncbi:MAG: flagellar basal body-associated FliL family protein [Hyphomonas sp.]
MKNIITAVIAIACIIAGGVGGHFLRTMSGGSGGDSHAEKPADDGHAAKDAKDEGHGEKKDDHGAKKDDHGKKSEKKDAHGKESASSSDVIYYKFSREFVVPIIRESRVQSLIILNLNIEADAELSQKLFEMEPKIRDNIMTTLVTLSNDGSTFESMTNVENYESLRSMVLMNLQTIVSSGIRNVLIVDFAKQDL